MYNYYDSWYNMLMDEVEENNDTLVCCTLTEEAKKEFYTGFGGPKGKPFTAWGKEYVYSPVVYDGAEWVESVPRNPCDKATYHIGGS